MRLQCNTVTLQRQSLEHSRIFVDLMLFLVDFLWFLVVISSRSFQSLKRVHGQILLVHVFRGVTYGLPFRFSIFIRICASMLVLKRRRILHNGSWMSVMESTRMISATSSFWTV